VISDVTNTVVATIPVGRGPNGVVGIPMGILGVGYDSGRGEVFVASQSSQYGALVNVISDASNTVTASIGSPSVPSSLTYDSGKAEMFVALGAATPDVLVISDSTNAVVATVATQYPWAAGSAFDPGRNFVLVANGVGNGSAAVISDRTNTVVENITTGSGPGGVAYDSGKGEFFVVNGSGNRGAVTVINDTSDTVVATIPVGNTALGAAYDPANGYVYVANMNSDTVSVISDATNTVVASIVGLANPADTVVDTHRGELFVSEQASNSVSIVPLDCLQVARPTATPGATDVSAPNPTVFATTASGGNGAPTYTWSGLPPGCTSLNASTVTCTPTVAGTYQVVVTVNDSSGVFKQSLPLTFVVNSQPSVEAIARPPAADVGEAVFLQGISSGGTSPFTYSWRFGDGGMSSIMAPSHTYNATGNYSVDLWVNDSVGLSAESRLSIMVVSALYANLSLSSSTPLLAQTVAIVAKATGGAGSYSYTYLGLPPGCVSVNKSSIGCLPTQAAWYNITVVVRDRNNWTANATAAMHVIFDFNVVVPASTALGQQLTILVNTNQTFSNSTNKTSALRPDSGYGAFTYNYTGLPPGCSSEDVSVLTCTPIQIGTYSISVSVHDQAGDHNEHTVAVHIVSAQGILGLPGYDGYLIVAVIVIAAILVAVFLGRRKGRSKAAATKGEDKETPPEMKAEPQAEEKATEPVVEKPAESPTESSKGGTVTVSQSDWEKMQDRLDKLERSQKKPPPD
jgi:YVTN family beta-propeller protein